MSVCTTDKPVTISLAVDEPKEALPTPGDTPSLKVNAESTSALPEPESLSQPELKPWLDEASEDQVTSSESVKTGIEEYLDHLEEEEIDAQRSGDRHEANPQTYAPGASTSITPVSYSARPTVLEQELSLDELASAINHSHQLCQGAYKSSLLHARKAGEFLLRAKAKVKESPSGRWLDWLETNCPDIPKRTAQAYMQVAAHWEQIEKSAASALFGLKDALKLLSKSKQSHAITSNPANVNAPANNVIDAQWRDVSSQSPKTIGPYGAVQPQQPSSVNTEDSLEQTALQLGLPARGNQTLSDNEVNSAPGSVDVCPKEFSSSISVNTDEICFSFIGSIEYLNHEHIVATVSELAQRTNPQKLEMMGDEELNLLVKKLNLLSQKVKALLLRRTPKG